MKFTTTAAILALLASLSTAASTPRNRARAARNAPVQVRQTSLGSTAFQLVASVKPGQDVATTEQMNGLYLNPYHVGAAENDVVFDSHPSNEPTYLNGTNLQFNFTSSTGSSGYNIPYSLTLPIEVEYASWQPTKANVGFGDNYGGFWINATGLQWTSDAAMNTTAKDNEFSGWLACNWWHGVPQLFWRNAHQYSPATSSCAEIELKVQFISV